MTLEVRPLGVRCNIQCQYCYSDHQDNPVHTDAGHRDHVDNFHADGGIHSDHTDIAHSDTGGHVDSHVDEHTDAPDVDEHGDIGR